MKLKTVPIVSVIIPVRNRQEMISKCLASVLHQISNDHEVIVVDNGSTDGTGDIVKNIARSDPRVKYINEPRRGIGNARYKGEKTAMGKVILMTDSDCEVPPKWIEKMTAPILEGTIPATQGLKQTIRRNYWSKHVEDEEKRIMWSFFELNGTSNVDTANFCIDRKVLKSVGYTDRTLGQLNDTELAARIFEKGFKVVLLDTIVGHHNPQTLRAVAGKLIQRGAYHSMLLKKYPDNPVFEHQTLRKSLAYVLGLAMEALKRDRSFLYDLVSGVSWRFGLLCGVMIRQR